MLNIDIEPTKGILFVRLSGKLNRKNITKLNREVISLLKTAGIKNIVFNINDLEYIDKYGKNAILNSFRICAHNKGQGFICINNNKKDNFKLTNIKNTKVINDELTAVQLINS